MIREKTVAKKRDKGDNKEGKIGEQVKKEGEWRVCLVSAAADGLGGLAGLSGVGGGCWVLGVMERRYAFGWHRCGRFSQIRGMD